MRLTGLVLAFALVVITACGQTESYLGQPRLELTDCSTREGLGEALCGTLYVAEDRTATDGGTIPLNILVLPALTPKPKPDALFYLVGGPGLAATEVAKGVQGLLHRVRRQRDIVLVDQRGTGQSNPLDCKTEQTHWAATVELDEVVELMRQCLEDLDANVPLYTTPIAMDDLDEVRHALGYEKINLYGGSYGVRAALEYMRRYPDRVRSAVLDGIGSTALRIPSFMGEDAQRAMDILLEDCRRDSHCNTAFPDLEQKLNRLLQRLEEPLPVRVQNPHTGEYANTHIQRRHLVELLHLPLYSAEFSALIPLAIHRADQGDFQPLLALGQPSDLLVDGISQGMHFTVICSEDWPRVQNSPPERAPYHAALGDASFERYRAICGIWPKGYLPPEYFQPVRAKAPTLLLSGALDPVTPPRWGEEVARHLPNSRHLIVPGVGHGVLVQRCGARLVSQFLESAYTGDLDTTCVSQLSRLPFFTSYTGPGPKEAP